MAATPSVSRSRRLLALLLCLLGVASVIYSYFSLPLYSAWDGPSEYSGWDWASMMNANMHSLGVTPFFLFVIGWALTPLVAATLAGVLGIARFVFVPKPTLAVLYLLVWALGAVVLGLTLLLLSMFGPRLGALGEVFGYALCFWADGLWRGKRPAHVNIWQESA